MRRPPGRRSTVRLFRCRGRPDALFLPITTEALWHSRAGNPAVRIRIRPPDSWPGGGGRGALGAICPMSLASFRRKETLRAASPRPISSSPIGWRPTGRTLPHQQPERRGLPHWPGLAASGRYLDFGVDGGARLYGSTAAPRGVRSLSRVDGGAHEAGECRATPSTNRGRSH